MKLLLMMLSCLFLFAIGLMAQTVNTVSEPSGYEMVFSTFAALVAIIPLAVEAIKKLVPSLGTNRLLTQIVSWLIGILITLIGWKLQLGFLTGLTWPIALAYGIGASLAANGIFDTGLLTWIIGLLSKKKQ